MELPADVDLSAVGVAHVYFAELALILGRVSDILFVSRNQFEIHGLSLTWDRYPGVPTDIGNIVNQVQGLARDLELWKDSLPQPLRLKQLKPGTDVQLPVVYELQ
jgi:hypothetical protein